METLNCPFPRSVSLRFLKGFLFSGPLPFPQAFSSETRGEHGVCLWEPASGRGREPPHLLPCSPLSVVLIVSPLVSEDHRPLPSSGQPGGLSV